MTSLRPHFVLRLALLALVAVNAGDTLLGSLTEPPPGSPPGTALVVDVFIGLLFLAFAAALWVATRRGPAEAEEARRKGLWLVFELVLAFCLTTDLLVVVAAQAPLVLSARRAAWWMSVQALATAGFVVLFSDSPSFYVSPTLTEVPRPLGVALSLGANLTWQFACFAVGLLAATEGRAREELGRKNAELAATQTLLEGSGRIAERLTIARELHDTLGHHLTVLTLQLELARRLTREGGDERLRCALEEAQTVTRLLLTDVREVVGELREDRRLGLGAALAALAESTLSPRIQLGLPDDLEHLDPARAHALFRTVQEAITNAVRHARARNLWIEVASTSGGDLLVTVHDDGRGAPHFTPGHGLTGMRERIEAVGGRLEIEPRSAQGFGLRAVLPTPTGALA